MIQSLFGFAVYWLSPLLFGTVWTLLVWILARAFWQKQAALKIDHTAETLIRPLTWLFILGTLILIGLNSLYTAFVWLGESVHASASYILSKGRPLYHDLDAPERYSLLYGPIMYLLTAGIFTVLGPSIMSAKLANGISLLALVCVAFLSLRRNAPHPRLGLAAFLLILVPMILVCSPLIILCALVAFHLHYFTTWRYRAAAAGICLGLATGVKIHSAVYFLPILLDLLFQKKFRDLLMLSLAAVSVIVLPFCLPNVDARNYLHWLQAATSHGISLNFFVLASDRLAYMVSVLLAVLILSQWNSRSEIPKVTSRGALLGAVGAVVLGTIVASKGGGGFHHLFPLVPSLVLLLIPVVKAIQVYAETRNWTRELHALVKLYLLGILAFGLVPLAHTYYSILRVPGTTITHDLRALMQRYPGARIALGDAESFPGEWQRKASMRGRTAGPILIFEGNPYIYEAMALMDMQKAGLQIPQQTISKLRDGTVDIWLFPKGRTPFNIVNWWDYATPVFSPEFKQAFFENYSYFETSAFYDLWIFHKFSETNSRGQR